MYRVLHHSVERHKERTVDIKNVLVSDNQWYTFTKIAQDKHANGAPLLPKQNFHCNWALDELMLSSLFTLSLDQYIGLLIEYIKPKHFVSEVLEDFVNVPIVGDLHVVEVQPGPCKLDFNTLHGFPDTP